MPRHMMLSGRYLGGHPSKGGETQAMLYVDGEGVRVKMFKVFINEPWPEIHALLAEGPDQAASRFTATRLLLAGPLALAWKKEKKLGFIVVQGSFGEFIFEVKKKTPQELRAALAPWVTLIPARTTNSQTGAPDVAEQASSPQTTPGPRTGLVAQREKFELLHELDALRKSGVLTDAEFDEQKQRILQDV